MFYSVLVLLVVSATVGAKLVSKTAYTDVDACFETIQESLNTLGQTLQEDYINYYQELSSAHTQSDDCHTLHGDSEGYVGCFVQNATSMVEGIESKLALLKSRLVLASEEAQTTYDKALVCVRSALGYGPLYQTKP